MDIRPAFSIHDPLVTAPEPSRPTGSEDAFLGENGPLRRASALPDEDEIAELAVEVVVRWGASVLRVAELSPPRSFFIGDPDAADPPSDCLVPSETLGRSVVPILLASAGDVRLVLLPAMSGFVVRDGESARSVEEMLAHADARPSTSVLGAMEVPLSRGTEANLSIGGFTFEVTARHAARRIPKTSFDGRALPFAGLSLLGHAALLGGLAFYLPPLGTTDEAGSTAEQRDYMLQALVAAEAIREPAERPEAALVESVERDRAGGTGARARNEEGAMGQVNSRQTGHRYSVAGPADNADVHVAKSAALVDARTFGVLGLLNGGLGGDPNAVTAAWGRDDSLGRDSQSFLGNMWGADPGESSGVGGLGLSGIGSGAGGRFEGIGLGSIGTIGQGSGIGLRDGFGPGSGNGSAFSGTRHKTGAPSMRVGATTMSGHIPPEVIQRIVRQNFGRFRACYESGLRSDPSLAGHVSVRFVIGRDGSTMGVANGGSDLPDGGVVSCVVRAFGGLSFPAPDDGIVTVVYPIVFAPG